MTGVLGRLSPQQFLARHWQKEPLLVRQAIPGFTGFLAPRDLVKLASRSNAVARTVTRKDARYQMREGPFARLVAPKRDFTLLVQGVEQHVDAAWQLLQRFAFIPTARIDDLMISWANTGGGVGPHFDAYDVFLLQGRGRRHWQITRRLESEHERACMAHGGLRILKQLEVAHEWTLAPGDMLYLPPNVGHHGVALDDDCMTYSIGFLAPSHEQLMGNFLAFLEQDTGAPDGVYGDPDLAPQQHPAEIVDDTLARVERILDPLRWDRERLALFVGRFLTGPKPSARFVRPRHALDLDAPGTLRLAGASRMLFRDDRFFVNGEVIEVAGARAAAVLRELADTRTLALPLGDAHRDDDDDDSDDDDEVRGIIAALYRAGFVVRT